MTDALERLVDSLLYEGYALYPYTPGATKNATPTPFGIVYPPAYTRDVSSTFDHLRLECVLEGDDAEVSCQVRFLLASGDGHQAEARQLGGVGDFRFGDVSIRLALEQTPLGANRRRVSFTVQNLTPAPAGLDRASALRLSLISTHPILTAENGRFVSQLDMPCASVNTWPVLASPSGDAMLGAAIVLPDHPQVAPESLGSLFDSTEIEEALLLHVKVLSDGERAAIDGGDPKVKEMIDRASAATPDEVLALHGRLTLTPPTPSAAVRDPSRGDEEAEVDGLVYRRGGKVVIRPGADADLHARLLDGHMATIERIYVDMDGKTYLAVTIDDDPGQELLRETNRFLFFFTPEVELVTP